MSSNIGNIITKNNKVTIEIATRSSYITTMENYEITLKTLINLFGNNFSYKKLALFGCWPETEENNKLIKLTEESHNSLFVIYQRNIQFMQD